MSDALLLLVQKKPFIGVIVIGILLAGGGMGLGALATKSMVDEKHAEAMIRIDGVEKQTGRDAERLYNAISRIEEKLDRVILRGRGR